MANRLIHNIVMKSKEHNYLIAGNVSNAFAIGEIGAADDFFLVGVEPLEENGFPLLTGNILNSEGDLLFRLARNVLIINPGHCSRVAGDLLGYEIHDSAGNMIFRVRTAFETLPGDSEESFVTTLAGQFYDKDGSLVLSANSGEPDEHIATSCKSVFGFAGSFGIVQDYDPTELELARAVLATRGEIYELLTGELDSEEIQLDGKLLRNATLTNCKIQVTTGNFDIGKRYDNYQLRVYARWTCAKRRDVTVIHRWFKLTRACVTAKSFAPYEAHTHFRRARGRFRRSGWSGRGGGRRIEVRLW